MTPTDPRYSRFGLCRDMLAAADVIRNFDPRCMAATAHAVRETGGLFLTGEGSSRIFPAKSIITHARRSGWPITLHTEAARQALEYDLSDWAVFALSNSGRTAEVIGLFSELESTGHAHRYSLTAFPGSKLESLAKDSKIASTPLTIIEGAAGPPEYKLAKDAEVTVMMWVESEVKVNQAFAKGKLDKKSVDSLVQQTKLILN